MGEIEQAILVLAGRCDYANQRDGSGFNAYDAEFGHSLAQQIEAGRVLTPKQRAAAERLVTKYRGQLQGMVMADDGEPNGNDTATMPAIVTVESDAVGVLGPSGSIARNLPGYESRPEQLRMAVAVEQAITANTHAVIEAGTGTGKSLGYLVPVIMSGKTAIVSTADKALQAQIWGKDIPFLQSSMDRPFSAALLKGRSNYLCLRDMERTKADLENGLFETWEHPQSGESWVAAIEWAASTPDGDLEVLNITPEVRQRITTDADGCSGRKCAMHATCWAEKAKKRAKDAQVVIVNHALLIRDLNVRAITGGEKSVLPDADIVVLDEAHHLEDVATDAFASEITAGRWNFIHRKMERYTRGNPGLADMGDAERAEQWMQEAETAGGHLAVLLADIHARMGTASTQKLGDERAIAKKAIDAIDALGRRMIDGTPTWLAEEEDRDGWEKLGSRVMDLAAALDDIATPGNQDVVRYAEAVKGGVKLVLKPIDVADILRSRLWTACLKHTGDDDEQEHVTVIATSATIATGSDMRYWKGRVGCDDARDLIVGSPFDYRHQALLYLPKDGQGFDPSRFYDGGSVEYYDRLASEIERLILASDGRAFVLFTSFRVLTAVHERLSPRLRQYLVLRQGEMPRQELTARFRDHGNAVLFGVKSFWEGVDVQGEALSLVVIDKLPFVPPDDPVWAARIERVKARGGNWFGELMVPYAIIALKQGFGRLIRTKTDRGVVAIMDGRLSTKGYGEQMLRSLPPATRTRSIDAVQAFYEAGN